MNFRPNPPCRPTNSAFDGDAVGGRLKVATAGGASFPFCEELKFRAIRGKYIDEAQRSRENSRRFLPILQTILEAPLFLT